MKASMFGLWVFLALTAAGLSAEMQLLTPRDSRVPLNPAPATDSMMPILSAEGRFVLFSSAARNLAGAISNQPLPLIRPQPLNVFWRDRSNGLTLLVSVNSNALSCGQGTSLGTGLSADGRFALFESSAPDIWPNDTNSTTDLFVRDLHSNVTHAVGLNTNGVLGNRGARTGSITPDGRYVAFVSDSNDLTPNDTNRMADIFVRDLATSQTVLISRGAMGAPSTWIGSDNPIITPDGRYVVFTSSATGLVSEVPPMPAGISDIYLAEVASGRLWWVSSGTRSQFGTDAADSVNPVISADGATVVYEGTSGQGKAGAIFLFHRDSGLTEVLHTNAGFETGMSLDMTPDARYVAFTAYASTASDDDTTCIVLADTEHGTNFIASAELDGSVTEDTVSDTVVLDPKGRYLLFCSDSPNLVPNLVEGFRLYKRDLQDGSITLVDVDADGSSPILDPAVGATISADGEVVAFDGLQPVSSAISYAVYARGLHSGSLEMVSVVDPAMRPNTPNGNSRSGPVPFSADGRYLVFTSVAGDLITNGVGGSEQVYIRDLASGAISLISAETNGLPGNALSYDPSISRDGNYVAFTSPASDLVSGDTNNLADVFLRDMRSGNISLVSVSPQGTPAVGGASGSPFVSADGQVVIFRSYARNLQPSANSSENLFARDLSKNTTFLLSPSGVGTPAITPDGRYVLVPRPPSLEGMLLLWDTHLMQPLWTNAKAGAVSGLAISGDGSRVAVASRVSFSPAMLAIYDWATGQTQYVASVGSAQPLMSFSPDGRLLAYAVRNGASPNTQIYLFNSSTLTNVLITHSLGTSAPANGNSRLETFDPSGRFVLFSSTASDLVENDRNDLSDLFIYDCLSGSITLVSKSRNGAFSSDGSSSEGAFTPDGKGIVLQSSSSDLCPNDFNDSSDLFLAKFGLSARLSWSGPKPTITWAAESGKQYRLEFKHQLDEAQWQSVDGQAAFTDGEATLTDEAADPLQRFYRVVEY